MYKIKLSIVIRVIIHGWTLEPAAKVYTAELDRRLMNAERLSPLGIPIESCYMKINVERPYYI